jgi:hypothetical protein
MEARIPWPTSTIANGNELPIIGRPCNRAYQPVTGEAHNRLVSTNRRPNEPAICHSDFSWSAPNFQRLCQILEIILNMTT